MLIENTTYEKARMPLKCIFLKLLTDDLKVSRAMDHGVSVDLTHVPATVYLLNAVNIVLSCIIMGGDYFDTTI